MECLEGYPGDFNYREFYRDIGFDLDYEYVKPYLHDGLRANLGIKYYKITGTTDRKEPYIHKTALDRAAEHAANFLVHRQKQVEWLSELFQDRKPLIVAPYDSELFGHWWFEGPEWINFLIRKMACDQDTVRLTTPAEYLAENPKCQMTRPSMSSWGHRGYSEVWLDDSNDWIYRHLHKAADRMIELAALYPHAEGSSCAPSTRQPGNCSWRRARTGPSSSKQAATLNTPPGEPKTISSALPGCMTPSKEIILTKHGSAL